MRKRQLLFYSLLLFSTLNYAEIVLWDATSGMLPSDTSIPISQRFELVGEASFLSMNNGYINMNDTSNPLNIGFRKTDISAISSEQDWAVETHVRMNSHSRDSEIDWGAYFGILEANKSILLTIATGEIGFMGADRHSFVDGVSLSFDASDSFHSYRIIKTDGIVNLYLDNNESASLSIPYANFGLWTGPTNSVFFSASSSIGTSNYDVAYFAYNLDGTTIPEPASLSLLALGGLLFRRKRKV
jgi:hypothetical protein